MIGNATGAFYLVDVSICYQNQEETDDLSIISRLIQVQLLSRINLGFISICANFEFSSQNVHNIFGTGLGAAEKNSQNSRICEHEGALHGFKSVDPLK